MSGSDSPNGEGTVGRDSFPDMTGAPREEVADLVDDLEEKTLAEAGDPQQKLAEDAHQSGTDRTGGDAEPPA